MGARFFGPEAWGPLARAFQAYQGGREDVEVLVHTDEGEADRLPVSLFFRGPDGLRGPDRAALARSRGRILDVGAGVGAVALILQEMGRTVTALEVIPEAVAIMALRGVEHPVEGTLHDLPPNRAFDTVLVLMNGAALAGTLAGLPPFLRVLRGLTDPGGQVLMDSTDLLTGSGWEPTSNPESLEEYPGNLHYQMEFRGVRGAPFPQLFVDPATLGIMAGEEGWAAEVVWQGDGGEYLARLTEG
jgi:SAM-dependent methyltransferase